MHRSNSWKTVLVCVAGAPLMAMGCSSNSFEEGGPNTESYDTDWPTLGPNTDTETQPSTPSSVDETSTATAGGTASGSSDAGDTSAASTSSASQSGTTNPDVSSSGTPSGSSSGTTSDVVSGTTNGGETGSDATDADSGSSDDETVINPDTLDNAGFENGEQHVSLPGWTRTGDVTAAYVQFAGSRTGWGRLGHWAETPYSVSTHQLVSPLPNGTYTFSMWVQRDSRYVEQVLFARGYSSADPDAEMTMSTAAAGGSGYTQIVLSGIPVDSGQVEVGVRSVSDADNVWANIDDAELTLEP